MGKLTASLISLLPILLFGVTQAGENGRYAHPQDLNFEAEDETLSCVELDTEISRLEPLTYSFKPGLYADPAHGLAIWSSVFWAPGISYLGYSGVAEYYDRRRMAKAGRRIAVLRQLKARSRCYQR